MTAPERKLAEFDGGRDQLRLVTASYDGNPRRYVRLQERGAGEWSTIGRAELHPALGIDRQGNLEEDGIVAEWGGYYSIRRTHHHRLVVGVDDGTVLVVRHEQGTTERHGGADTPDWTLRQAWHIGPEEVHERGGERR